MLKKILYIIVLVLMGTSDALAFNKELTDSIRSLDELLMQKDYFTQQKENRISELKAKLSTSSRDDEQYTLCINLYEEYKAYQYDSAYHYANKSFSLATNLNNLEYKLESKCALIFCLLSAGLYKEAFDEFQKIDCQDVGVSYKQKYYSLAIRLNYAISDYNHSSPFYEKYVNAGNLFTDSILQLIPAPSPERHYFEAQRQMKNREYAQSIATFENLISHDSINTHDKAIIHSCLGWMYWQNGNTDLGLKNLIESAKCDIKASVKETTALCGLGELLYNMEDIDRAKEYVQQSLNDANFYGARHRKIEINNILPIIEQDRYILLQHQRNIVLIGGAIILLLVIALSLAFVVVFKHKKKLEEAQLQIAERNHRLTQINSQLQEVNKIKNEYIGNSFYQSSRFIDNMENIYKTVSIKIAARQYNDVGLYLKNTMIKEERNNMFNVFDKTFLRIFPHFIEQYNQLFPESERKYPDQTDTLTTEMRIFALIRLGVTESDKIAQFLNKSIHTINTYKTRVKNKSLIENEQFEARIMEIGRVSEP